MGNKFPKISVTTHSSQLYHIGAVKERIENFLKANIYKELIETTEGETPNLFIRIVKNEVQVFDTFLPFYVKLKIIDLNICEWRASLS